jgi:selenocysteine lyase/cysteine desulfurase
VQHVTIIVIHTIYTPPPSILGSQTQGHKHFYTSRGVCFLWARSGRPQKLLSPLVIDGGGTGTLFEKSFAYQGTTDDFTRYIAAGASLDFRDYLGGEEKVRRYTSNLARDACDMLSKAFKTRRLPDSLQANMCNVELPCGDKCPREWGYKLFHKYKFYAAMYSWAGTTWFRLTASVYNEMADYTLIKNAVLENCDGAVCHAPLDTTN